MTDFEIDAFFTIVQTGSITKAAASLGITQSALSRRLLSLEEALGYSLLVHQKGVRSVQLTEEGKEFFGIAQKWKLLWNEARALSSVHGPPILKIAATDSVNTYIMPSVFQAFSRENPQVHLESRTYHSKEAFTHVERGSLDIAIITAPPQFSSLINVEQLYSEPLLCVTGKNTNYANGISPSDLDVAKEVRFIRTEDFDSWHSYWFPDERPPYIILDKFSFNSDYPLVGDNWAFIPASIAYHLCQTYGTLAIDVKNPPPNRFAYYVTQNKPKPEILLKFIDSLKLQVKITPGIHPL